MTDVPGRILELVQTFHNNRDQYRSTGYTETETRVEFINPFFKELGWDVTNEKGWAEDYKDVVNEDAIKAGAPDYAFRIGGRRKFFVEAKNPGIAIEFDARPAYQLRRYAWSNTHTLAILTNFDGFAVYDCRFRPYVTDGARKARIEYIKYTEYEEKWDYIAGIFSKDAVLRGSFDRFAADTGRRGTSPVDQEFLKEIEQWRAVLAQDMHRHFPLLSVRELNFAVQRTIDRIIFLRMCEDRKIEPAGQLQGLLNGKNLYQRLLVMYHAADDRYNSGLFHFTTEKGRSESPDTLTPSLMVDDKVLKQIIDGLYYPKSPYEFSYIGADILGSVYEQFLGRVIVVKSPTRADVEEKPEVKKAGGVYYTPTYIVDYIVRNTVGKLCDGKTPKEVTKLRVLDPACGSGSFLIGAYGFLLEWHRDKYRDDGPEKHKKAIYQGAGGLWYLTMAEKRRILLNNIFGVDIDGQAVEVTKLNLLLKVLENENQETVNTALRLLHQRALPDLANNIKCGNSLIGSDFDTSGLTDEETQHINPFDWDKEFPSIISKGGFDAVIGNPPYVRQESISRFKDYLQTHYEAYAGAADLYVYFIERSLQLAGDDGLFSFIVSSKFVRAGYGEKLCKLIPAQSIIREFLDFGDLPVFQGATVYPCIFILQKEKAAEPRDENNVRVCNVRTLDFGNLDEYVADHEFPVPQSELRYARWRLHPEPVRRLLSKMDAIGTPLPRYCGCDPLFGVKTGLNEVFIVREDQIDAIAGGAGKDIFLPYVRGRDVWRYGYAHTGDYLLFTDGISAITHPHVMDYLKKHRAKLEARTDIKHTSKRWYELRPCSYYDLLRKPKIVYSSMANTPSFALDETGIFVDKTCYFIPQSDKYLLGVLNSRALFFYVSCHAVERRGGYYEYLTEYVEQFPIRTIDLDDSKDKARHGKMVKLVDRMLDLHKKLGSSTLPDDNTQIQRQIAATDREIDKLVYELYGLTDEEIRIVEGETDV